ncbi:TrkA family potassium uptake protein [candidate division KSB1 bacterium]|nr:TrkA family potassium uptake protein [candidate division KSB1 bacterium]RQW02900.1 MAG: TrkA family potassium uptake protein [candidate division KSB1 bacterium]
MKSFAIIGLSSFGHFLAKALASSGHQIIVIDRDEDRVERVKSFVDKAIVADATDKETLASIGLGDVDGVIVSLGDQMDASVLVTLYLRELKVRNIVAKALTEDHGKILNIIGANRVVFPERDQAYRLAKILESQYVLDSIDLSDKISIIEIAPPREFIGRTLGELDLRRRYGVLVLIIKEVIPEEIVFVPNPDHLIKDTSILMILGENDKLAKIKKMK